MNDRFLDWSKINTWKIIKNEGTNVINLETQHSFEIVLDHICKRLTDITMNEYMINLRDVEKPQADPSWTRSNYSPKKLLESSYLPRAVLMYDINSGLEPLVEIPSMQRANRTLYPLKYKFFNVKEPLLKDIDDNYYNYMRDVGFGLTGIPRYSAFTAFWSILVNERPKAIELMKQLKWKFPLNESTEIYAGRAIRDEKDGRKFYPIPFTSETYIPEEMIKIMKNALQFDCEDSDQRLLDVIKKHSDTRVEMKINSGEGGRVFSITYPTPVIITPTSIDLIDMNDNNIKTFGVKFELRVDYIDFPIFRFGSIAKCINKANEGLLKEPMVTKDGCSNLAEVHQAKFKDEINGTTILHTYKLEYSEEDVKDQIDSETFKLTRVVKLFIPELIDDVRLAEYIRELQRKRCSMDICSFFNVEAKRAFLRGNDDGSIIGMDEDFEYDKNSMMLVDKRGKKGDIIFLAIYINKKHFVRWLTSKGYAHLPNLSSTDA